MPTVDNAEVRRFTVRGLFRRSALRLRMTSGLCQLAAAAALLACSEDAGAVIRSEGAAGLSDAADMSATETNDGSADQEHGLDSGVLTMPGPIDASAADRPDPTPIDAQGGDADAAPARRASLVLPELWTALGAAEDPFQDRPEVVDCPAFASMAETLNGERVFSVDTGSCNYLTVTQTTRREIAAGETIKVRLWHFELSAPEAAEAHAAVLVDGLQVLEERVAIPQAGGLISRQMRVERAIPVGARVHFHLHNHGANSWALVEVSAGP